jgi:hypothetical protein
MPDKPGESPPGSFDKVPAEACFDRRRTGDECSFGCPSPQGKGKEPASARCQATGSRSGRGKDRSSLRSRPQAKGRSLLRPDAERPDLDPVVARIGVRFDPGRTRIATRASARMRSAKRSDGPGSGGTLGEGPSGPTPKGERRSLLRLSQGTRGASAPREPDGPVEACFRRFQPGTGQASAWTGPGPETGRAWSRPQPGSPARDGFASRRRRPDWDSGGWWQHQPPLRSGRPPPWHGRNAPMDAWPAPNRG